VDISHVFSAKDIAQRCPVTLMRKTPIFGSRSALQLLPDEDRDYGYVVERGNKFIGVASIDSIKKALDDALLEAPTPVPDDMPISELISLVAQAPCAVPVFCDAHNYLGIISKAICRYA